MAQDNRQWTALHYASYNGHPNAVNTLLKYEADFDKLSSMKNSQGRIAFIISKNDNVKKSFNRKLKFSKYFKKVIFIIIIFQTSGKLAKMETWTWSES